MLTHVKAAMLAKKAVKLHLIIRLLSEQAAELRLLRRNLARAHLGRLLCEQAQRLRVVSLNLACALRRLRIPLLLLQGRVRRKVPRGPGRAADGAAMRHAMHNARAEVRLSALIVERVRRCARRHVEVDIAKRVEANRAQGRDAWAGKHAAFHCRQRRSKQQRHLSWALQPRKYTIAYPAEKWVAYEQTARMLLEEDAEQPQEHLCSEGCARILGGAWVCALTGANLGPVMQVRPLERRSQRRAGSEPALAQAERFMDATQQLLRRLLVSDRRTEVELQRAQKARLNAVRAAQRSGQVCLLI